MSRPVLLLVVAAAVLAAPSAAEARWTAWKVGTVQHRSTWDWRETATTCTSADAVVLSEQGTKTLLSLTPQQVRRVARRRGGRSVPGLADGIFLRNGPFGVVEGRGRAAVRSVQVVQECGVTGYDEAGDPSFGPVGSPVSDTCEEVVEARFEVFSFLPLEGRLGKSVGVRLIEDVGAEPVCPARPGGYGTLGPAAIAGSIPVKRVALSRFFGARTTVALQHSRSRTTPAGDATIVGSTTTRSKVALRRITRPEACFPGRRRSAVVERRFVCTAR